MHANVGSRYRSVLVSAQLAVALFGTYTAAGRRVTSFCLVQRSGVWKGLGSYVRVAYGLVIVLVINSQFLKPWLVIFFFFFLRSAIRLVL